MKLLTLTLLFAFFVSGLMFAYRTLMQCLRERMLVAKTLAKIGTANVLVIIIIAFALSLANAVVVISVLQIVLCSLTPVVTRFRGNQFCRSVLFFLDEVILSMKSGRAFRSAFDEAKNRCDAFTQQKLSEIMSLVAFSQHQIEQPISEFARFLVDEFKVVDAKPHRSIQRLQVLRERLKTEQSFRRRSGEATRQVQMQAIVLLILYLSLIAFVASQVNLRAHVSLLVISLSLFITGYFVMWLITRSFRWKV